ncbi:tRNA lysidine(34) synthetase TilS [Pseudoruegeria sp. HB172150]|uniref:tRNA lysidine(34) synthetase TilS n=1 Tax=Pseudoruegeria sp. HB172150 TaxID=2721164 RepID=UPI001C132303|nr:tRNA lysidine(34) synthetase TilS [Pseudoruegeria sp. HB172150]
MTPTPEQAVSAHFQMTCPDGPGRIAVAVSGGGDSLALLCLMRDRFADVVALTVDHGLRPEAAEEARTVGDIAATLNVPHDVLRWRWDGAGNLSEEARKGRYAALAAWCVANDVAHCATGHTRDDNVESFFLGLMRGAGLDGLCGMRPTFETDGVTFHRPLLEISRDALRTELRTRGIAWIEDPTNDNTAYDRARIRKALATLDLPDDQIARSVANLAATRRDLGFELERRLSGSWRLDGPDLVVETTCWDGLTAEFRRRTLTAAIRFLTGTQHAPRSASLMRLVQADWSALPGPATLQGCTFAMDPGGLRIGRELAAVSDPVPSREKWDNRWTAEGPHGDDATIRATGEAGLLQLDPAWKDGTIPRRSMLAAPSLWRGDRLTACPFADPADSGARESWRWSPQDDSNRFIASIRSA